jgi:hypothetical protein
MRKSNRDEPIGEPRSATTSGRSISGTFIVALVLARRFEADYFAMFFAAASALAGVEAIRRSL